MKQILEGVVGCLGNGVLGRGGLFENNGGLLGFADVFEKLANFGVTGNGNFCVIKEERAAVLNGVFGGGTGGSVTAEVTCKFDRRGEFGWRVI